MVESKHQWKAWLYLAPAIVLLLIFTLWPIINTVSMAFLVDYDINKAIGGTEFEFGFANFANIVNFAQFKTCLLNTILLCVITVPLSTAIALLIAVCLNSIKPLNKTLQTIYFLPYVTNSIAIGMVFFQMFNIINVSFMGKPQEDLLVTQGIINHLLKFFGADPINWINQGSSYAANIATMVIYIVWNALPFKILILLGGLQSVNKQYYDAAKVDGTSRARTLWRITVPLLSPMIAYVVITGFIGGFKEYTSIVGVFGEAEGPIGDAGSMSTVVSYIYAQIAEHRVGEAAAAAVMLFIIIMVFTGIKELVGRKRVHY